MSPKSIKQFVLVKQTKSVLKWDRNWIHTSSYEESNRFLSCFL